MRGMTSSAMVNMSVTQEILIDVGSGMMLREVDIKSKSSKLSPRSSGEAYLINKEAPICWS